MWEWMFGSLDWLHVAILMLGALLVGVNKTGIPAFGIVIVVLFAQFFPPGYGSAATLTLLCSGDLIAVSYYRRKANWRLVWKMLPWALLGLACGCLAVSRIHSDRMLSLAIGIMILFVQSLSLLQKVGKERIAELAGRWYLAAFFGIMAGFTTQVANAAGPVTAIYLLLMGLKKEEYIGSIAWFFLVINWTKLPLFALDGRMTWEVLHILPGMVLPLLVGAALGIYFLRHIPQKWFQVVIQVFVTVGALRLIAKFFGV